MKGKLNIEEIEYTEPYLDKECTMHISFLKDEVVIQTTSSDSDVQHDFGIKEKEWKVISSVIDMMFENVEGTK